MIRGSTRDALQSSASAAFAEATLRGASRARSSSPVGLQRVPYSREPVADLSNRKPVRAGKLSDGAPRGVHRPEVLDAGFEPTDQDFGDYLFLEPLVGVGSLHQLVEMEVTFAHALALPDEFMGDGPLHLTPNPEPRERDEWPLCGIEAPACFEDTLIDDAADLLRTEEVSVASKTPNRVAVEERTSTEREK